MGAPTWNACEWQANYACLLDASATGMIAAPGYELALRA